MNDFALTFVVEKYNKNSISALCGSIEIDSRLKDLEIHFIELKKLKKEINSLLSNYETLMVAFSFCTPNLIDVANALDQIKSEISTLDLHRIKFLAGGPHPSGDIKGTLEIGFEFVVFGEGEETLPNLIWAIAHKKDYKDIKGLSFIEDNQVRRNPRPNIINLNKYPPFSTKYKRFGAIEISRGCPWVCKYCQTPYLFGGKMRHRNVETIAYHTEIIKSHGLKDLRFVTPDAFAYGSNGKNVNLYEIEKLLKAVSEIYGKDHIYFGSFPSEVRPDMVTKDAVDLILQYAANDNLIIGAQSGSQRILDSMHRGHTVGDIYEAVKIVADAGLIPNVDFIFGYPGESKQDREKTLEFIDELIDLGARIHSHTFTPLSGTPLYKTKPGVIDRKTKKVLGLLASQGKQYGSWQQQEHIGKKLITYWGNKKTP